VSALIINSTDLSLKKLSFPSIIIFEKGFWGSAAKMKDGSGVGLFLARKLAKQIGGDLRLLENNSIDNTEKLKNLKKKNIFYLELPIKELHV